MYILHIITGLETGGAETMLLKILTVINKNKFSHIVVTLKKDGPMKAQYLDKDIEVVELNMKGITNALISLKRLKKIVKRFRPRIIQGWMYHGNIISLLLKYICGDGAPVLWNIRHSLYDIRKEKKLTALVIKICSYISSRTQAIIYNSKTSAHQHEAYGYDDSKTILIGNGFDCKRFRPIERSREGLCDSLKIDKINALVGLIARYHPIKDHRNFIEAAAILKRKYENISFILVGNGVNENNHELTAMISDNGLSKNVYLLGKRKDIPEIMSALDMLVSASWGEAFPNVIGEAMACATPCVVTDVGESADIVGECGFVVPVKKPEALSSAISRLIEIGEKNRKKLGDMARNRILKNYSLEKIARSYEKLYEGLASK